MTHDLEEEYEANKKERLKQGFEELGKLIRAQQLREEELYLIRKQVAELDKGLRVTARDPALYEEVRMATLKTPIPKRVGSGRPKRQPLKLE